MCEVNRRSDSINCSEQIIGVNYSRVEEFISCSGIEQYIERKSLIVNKVLTIRIEHPRSNDL